MADLSHLNLDPPIVTLHRANNIDVSNIINNVALRSAEIRLLKSLVDLSERNHRPYCSAKEISECLGIGIEAVRNSLSSLAKKNIFNKIAVKASQNTRRSAWLYQFNITVTPEHEEIQPSLPLFYNTDSDSLVNPRDEVFGKADDLIFRLAVALEHSHKSKSTQTKTNIYVGEEALSVTVSSMAGQVLARVKDIKYYVAILRLCSVSMQQRIERYEAGELEKEYLLNNVFVIPETDILQSMNYDRGTPTRQHMKKAIDRLEATEYKINETAFEYMQSYNLKEYQGNIEHFKVRHYAKNSNDRVVYVFELSDDKVKLLYKECKEDDTVLKRIDPRIYTESNPLAFIFTFYISNLEQGKIIKYTWALLKDHVAPNMPMLSFMENLSELLYKKRIIAHDEDGKEIDDVLWARAPGKNKVLEKVHAKINGISVVVTPNQGITIQRDIQYKLAVSKQIKSPNVRRVSSAKKKDI